jgi:hypothetical protein
MALTSVLRDTSPSRNSSGAMYCRKGQARIASQRACLIKWFNMIMDSEAEAQPLFVPPDSGTALCFRHLT